MSRTQMGFPNFFFSPRCPREGYKYNERTEQCQPIFIKSQAKGPAPPSQNAIGIVWIILSTRRKVLRNSKGNGGPPTLPTPGAAADSGWMILDPWSITDQQSLGCGSRIIHRLSGIEQANCSSSSRRFRMDMHPPRQK